MRYRKRSPVGYYSYVVAKLISAELQRNGEDVLIDFEADVYYILFKMTPKEIMDEALR